MLIPYAGSFRQYPTSEGHIIKVKVKYQGYISQKMAVLGALSVSQTHLVVIIKSKKTSDWLNHASEVVFLFFTFKY